jgi:hypothetical protein
LIFLCFQAFDEDDPHERRNVAGDGLRGWQLRASGQLKRDAMLAYKALGGPEYLKRNPELLDKTLLKMVAEPAQKTDAVVRIIVDAPWLSPQRLSYQRDSVMGELGLMRGAEIIDMPEIVTPPPNTPGEIDAARQSHLDAQAKARAHDKGQPLATPGPDQPRKWSEEVVDLTSNPAPWRPEGDRQPKALPLVTADDLLPPPDPRTVANPSAPGAKPKTAP